MSQVSSTIESLRQKHSADDDADCCIPHPARSLTCRTCWESYPCQTRQALDLLVMAISDELRDVETSIHDAVEDGHVSPSDYLSDFLDEFEGVAGA